MRKVLLLLVTLVLIQQAHTQILWNDLSQQKRSNQVINPADYRTLETEIHALTSYLYLAPHEQEVNAKYSEYILNLPAPDGTFQTFRLVEAPVMAPELQAMFPSIRSYAGQGIEDPTATLRCSISPKGFHAMVLSSNGDWFMDPIAPGDLSTYISYTKEAFYATTTKVFEEQAPEITDLSIDIDTFDENLNVPHKKKKKINGKEILMMGQKTSNGTQLRTYRLALACTGEYAAYHGGTTILALAAMNVSMTRVNGVYEKEVAIRMVLVPNNNLLVYLNAATDPYDNGNGSTMLGQNQTTCNAVIGTANYDIGHVFSTGGGGIASLNSPCTVNKARGVTGQVNPIGDAFDIDYVAHEMGHQFGGNHTQNNSCNRASNAAYEPGSASTIMGYAGICSPNLQSNSDAYFHNKSFNEIYTFSVTGTGNSCAAITSTGNIAPLVEAGTGGWTIPISTPFELTAVGSDANGDAVTYCWEQFDLGPATAVGDLTLTNPSGNQPIFRSWTGTTNPTRVFPRIGDLVNNTVTIGEHLPTYDRNLSFKCTARDNRAGGGGVTDDIITFAVDDVGGPFVVTAPNTGVTWPANSAQTVTWNVANTTAAPISCSNVSIYLSIDGGFTYPILVLANTPNDGSQLITVPNILTTQARIKVKAANNIFFDISNTNFTISAGAAIGEDLSLLGINQPSGSYCGDEFTPEIVVLNLGTVTITSFDVLYNIDGGANSTYSWTGTLATGASVTLTLPTMSAATGAHTFNVNIVNPNGTTDDNIPNNVGSSTFSTIADATIATLTLLTDCWGEEVSWNIENSSNVIIASQAVNTLGDQTTYTNTFCLPSGCYDFNIFDSFGDGLDGTSSGCPFDGNYNITDDLGNILVIMGIDNYGTGTTHTFCVPVGGEPVPGCNDLTACNFDPLATQNDGSCTYPGCTDPLACNYNALAGCSDSSCILPPVNDVCANAIPLTLNAGFIAANNINSCTEGLNPTCGGTFIHDVWYSFVYTGGTVSIATSLGSILDTRLALWTACGGTLIACDDDSGPGLASLITRSCPNLTPGTTYYIQAGGYNSAEGTFNIQVTLGDLAGCTNPLATNYNACATVDNGLCIISGCTDPTACNYDAAASQNNGTCTYPGCTNPLACNYNALAACDNGTCILPGCLNSDACNYNPLAGCSDGSCVFPGCNNPLACNFNPLAGCDNGSCTLPGCTNSDACNYNPLAGCSDGSCVFPGCTNPLACNYNPSAGCDDGTCTLPGCTNSDACNYNPLAGCSDGSCVFPGCTNPLACNYNALAGCDDGTCTLPGCTNSDACNYNPLAGCSDGSCVFPGCTNPLACNYNALAGCDNGTCTLPGCTNAGACNYNPLAGCDDGLCVFPGCIDPIACNFNASAGCSDGSCTYPGCTNPMACNYDVLAGCDNGSCTLPGCTDPVACNYSATSGCDDGTCDYSCLGCIGDFNDDGFVGITDLLILLGAYGCNSGCGEPDLSGDDIVGTADLLIFLSYYGTVCP
jgi:hypothetical protein